MSAQPDYIQWYPGAIALASSLLNLKGQPKERAKDIVQQAVTQLIERGEHLGAHRQAWFFTVVRNACIDELRRQHKYVADAERLAAEQEDTGPAEQMIAQEGQQQIRQALHSLSFEQREILLLRDVNDLSYAAIAQVLTINVGTVMSRLHRARMALRTVLQASRAQAGQTTGVSSVKGRTSVSQSKPLPKEVL